MANNLDFKPLILRGKNPIKSNEITSSDNLDTKFNASKNTSTKISMDVENARDTLASKVTMDACGIGFLKETLLTEAVTTTRLQ